MTYKKMLTIVLIIVLILLLCIIGYIGYEFYKKYNSDKEVSQVLDDFDKLVIELGNTTPENSNPPTVQNQEGMGGIKINALYYKGYKVIGKLEMPSVNLQYPVLDVLTDARAIDYAPAVQFGAGINKIGNTTIIAHNTYNGTFFGKNKKMQIGDIIYLTDLKGKRIGYEIFNKYITSKLDSSHLERKTNGYREVTLVTCDNNNKNRLIICAREII